MVEHAPAPPMQSPSPRPDQQVVTWGVPSGGEGGWELGLGLLLPCENDVSIARSLALDDSGIGAELVRSRAREAEAFRQAAESRARADSILLEAARYAPRAGLLFPRVELSGPRRRMRMGYEMAVEHERSEFRRLLGIAGKKAEKYRNAARAFEKKQQHSGQQSGQQPENQQEQQKKKAPPTTAEAGGLAVPAPSPAVANAIVQKNTQIKELEAMLKARDDKIRQMRSEIEAKDRELRKLGGSLPRKGQQEKAK